MTTMKGIDMEQLGNKASGLSALFAALSVSCFVLGASFSGCGDDGCEVQSTRCDGERIEICNADKEWEFVMDCSGIEPGNWLCAIPEDTGDAECVQVESLPEPIPEPNGLMPDDPIYDNPWR